MATYLGFLRAINLGPTRKFAKGDIVAATEAAGFGEVATYINTGNVRFTTAMRSRPRIEAALETAYVERAGFEVPTIVFRAAELAAIAEEGAALDHDGRHHVLLLKDELSPAVAARIEASGDDLERARVSGRAVHLLLGDQFHTARLPTTVERLVGVATNRNLTVIRAVAERWCG